MLLQPSKRTTSAFGALDLMKVNALTRGCRVSFRRLKELVPIIAKRFNVPNQDAFKAIQATRGMQLTEDNINVCPDCAGDMVFMNMSDKVGLSHRHCNDCGKNESLHED